MKDYNTNMILERWKLGNNSWGGWKIIYTDKMLSNSKQMGLLASALGVPNTRTYYAGNSARLIKVSGFVLTSNDCYLIFIFGEHNTDKSGFFCLSNSHPGNGMNIGKVYAAANEWEFYKDSSGNYYIKIATWGQVNISIYKSTHNITTEMIAYDTTGLTPVTVIE